MFFFQAEDGIRDPLVTGVQTCALPISCNAATAPDSTTTCGRTCYAAHVSSTAADASVSPRSTILADRSVNLPLQRFALFAWQLSGPSPGVPANHIMANDRKRTKLTGTNLYKSGLFRQQHY